MNLSRVGHMEETMFTYNMFLDKQTKIILN